MCWIGNHVGAQHVHTRWPAIHTSAIGHRPNNSTSSNCLLSPTTQAMSHSSSTSSPAAQQSRRRRSITSTPGGLLYRRRHRRLRPVHSGLAVASTMTTSMVLDAIEHAILTRHSVKRLRLKAVVHHTDRGPPSTRRAGSLNSSPRLDAGLGRSLRQLIRECPSGLNARHALAVVRAAPTLPSLTPGVQEPRVYWDRVPTREDIFAKRVVESTSAN